MRATKTEILKYTQVECIPIYSAQTEYIILMCSVISRYKRSEKNESYTVLYII